MWYFFFGVGWVNNGQPELVCCHQTMDNWQVESFEWHEILIQQVTIDLVDQPGDCDAQVKDVSKQGKVPSLHHIISGMRPQLY